MNVETLSQAIEAAESEKVIWLRGRTAFRRHGLRAFNPYLPDASPMRDLWEEGFNYERDAAAERQPRF
ncbi:hypothetical protein [Aurantimonas sp. 22II-16-19i]|uniref:hypothetical protein n=1 Tax=Aurantimonas sp. 22II-16-19i TaxID=1317114 RepID=UPI0009F7ABD7|nr:hypothetical protein [Aurantimonas sp. 22II-16-19i]ORE89662.1 hypothetical protein ATO4_24107 [Aurantimonas sp. 22II-16-19i]